MHFTMMEAAKGNEIGGFSLAAMCPMMNVVSVNEAFVRTAWKTATLIARIQRAAQRGRNASSLIADIQRFAALIFDN